MADDEVVIERTLLRQLLQVAAIPGCEYCSLEEGEVRTLRQAAMMLGLDPDTVTPSEFLCLYTGEHPLRRYPRNIEEEAPRAVMEWCHTSGVRLSSTDRNRMIAHIIDKTPPPSMLFCPRCGKTEGDAPPPMDTLAHHAALALGFIKGPEGA